MPYKSLNGRRRPKKETCSQCGWEDTTARCVFCGEPICAGCARPAFSKDGEEALGPAMVSHDGRRGRVCPEVHPEDPETQTKPVEATT